MRAVVATHGHCFDGLASAVVFTRLLRELRGPDLACRYVACGYSGSPRNFDKVLDGDENAVLDYRFAASDKLQWYFDHHKTAFANAADLAFFESRREQMLA